MRFCMILILVHFTFANDNLNQKDLMGEVNLKMMQVIWERAMAAKIAYNQLDTRDGLIDNLASTAPREDFIANLDIAAEMNDGDPSASVLVSTNNQFTWSSGDASPLGGEGYENTWEAHIPTNGNSNIAWYISGEVDSGALDFDYGRIIVSQTPKNITNAFPPGNHLYATLATDPTGDASSDQDIYDVRGTYSDNSFYMSMGINGGCCDEGGFFGPWYLYGIAIVNPDADIETAAAYAIGYGDGGFGQLVPGLYKITGDLLTGEVETFEIITENISYSTSGNDLQVSTLMSYIIEDPDWGPWPNSFEGFITLGVTVEAFIDGLDVGIELKDDTVPGLMLLSTQFQNGNTDCALSNPMYDTGFKTWSVDYADAEGNLPHLRQLQICVADDGPCYYFADMIADEHTYDGTVFQHTLPDIITDLEGNTLPDGPYVVKMWFADGEIGDAQIQETVLIIDGEISDGEVCASPGDVNGDGLLNVLDVVLTVSLVLCLDGGDCYNLCADMNGDGIINVLDVVSLVNEVLNN